ISLMLPSMKVIGRPSEVVSSACSQEYTLSGCFISVPGHKCSDTLSFLSFDSIYGQVGLSLLLLLVEVTWRVNVTQRVNVTRRINVTWKMRGQPGRASLILSEALGSVGDSGSSVEDGLHYYIRLHPIEAGEWGEHAVLGRQLV
ncbi:hypothetical protein Tco_0334995, partial [Tanacetum coccineum]